MRGRAQIAIGATLAMTMAVAGWAASPKDRRFVSAKHGVGVEAPPGWTLSLHTGYPRIIALMLHPNGSRISVSVSETPARNARELAEQNRRGLEAQKLTVSKVSDGPRESVVVDARAKSRDEILRQMYLVRAVDGDKRQAIVVTLTTRAQTLAEAISSLDLLIARLSLEPPRAVPSEAARAEGSIREADGSAPQGSAEKQSR